MPKDSPNRPNHSPVLEVMIRAANRAGESLRADLARPDLIEVREKGASDFVSSADLRSQAIIRAALTEAYPDYGLLLEEGDDRAAGEGPRFVVDPLDGTTNFLHAIPHFAVSIALEARRAGGLPEEREIVAGVVLDVMKGELFCAEKGGGAWLGERSLSVSRERDLGRSIIGTGIPHRGRGDHPRFLTAMAGVMNEVAGIRRLGAAALDLAYVAAGRFEAFFETGLSPWDVAAGALLVTEAGGVVTQTGGKAVHLSGDVLASSNAQLHAALVEHLAPLRA
jgi:myo-inositol-1(or 4)-monophosphatase